MRRAALATLLCLLFCEVALRGVGLGPWARFESFDGLPPMSDPHPDLGWVNRPGSYRYVGSDGPVEVQIHPSGSRGVVGPGATSVLLIGGSFLFGYGLSDRETVGVQLQSLRPDLSVTNRSVPGYGTLQSLMLESRHEGASVVVYGLVDLHDSRNAPAWSWLHGLERSAQGQGWAAVPGAWWDGAELQYSPPTAYRHWTASEHSALVDRVERTYIEVHDRFLRTKSETTVQLMLRFREAVEARGARFVVALLHAPSRQEFYLWRLAEEGIDLVDLRHPEFPAWALRDGHPDERVHRDWAVSLAEVL